MITILSDFRSPRLDYVAETVFRKWMEIDYEIVTSVEDVIGKSCCISYGNQRVDDSIQIFSEGLLAENFLRSNFPNVVDVDGAPQIFQAPKEGGHDLGFDLFSSVFFCLSRYEEYLVSHRDKHGRFQASSSVFYGYHQKPYVDRWLGEFERLIVKRIPAWNRSKKSRWLSTMDMDIAFAYKGRGLRRLIGAVGKDILSARSARLKERYRVLRGKTVDPFDTSDFFLSENDSDARRVFIPSGKRSGYDVNLNIENKELRSTLKSLSEKAGVGLHPSYRSLGNRDLISEEKTRLENLLSMEITESRQHFLRFSLPETFRDLCSLGIKKDYSMGFHDDVGFRSGTAYAHCFYDLKREGVLDLEINPLILMDSAMKNYLKVSRKEAIILQDRIFRDMNETGGVFTTVWHNHSLSDTEDWTGWKKVYESLPNLVRSHR